MKKRLTSKEVVFQCEFQDEDNIVKDGSYSIQEYRDVYEQLYEVISQDKNGELNIYLIDDFSKGKVDELIGYIDDILKEKVPPKDICYVIYDDEKSPKVLVIENGMGNILSECLQYVQENMYKGILKFYSSSSEKSKDAIMDELYKKRTELIESLVDQAKNEGFDIKATNHGFAFMPLKAEGDAMTTKEYDDLDFLLKEEIVAKVSKLKILAEEILESIKDMEDFYLDKVKSIMKKYLENEKIYIKNYCINKLDGNEEGLKYIDFVLDDISKVAEATFTGDIDNDEDVIEKEIYKFLVNVIADNTNVDHPRVIFEENPSVSNLMGKIEYENQNGSYLTSPSLISGGSLIKANEGILILRINDLLNNAGSYSYLIKALFSNKISYDFYRSYIEIISLSSLNIEEMKFNTRVILIGDMKIYNILSEYDEDFKRLFPISIESNPVFDVSKRKNIYLKERIEKIINDKELLPIDYKGYKEIIKYLCRKSESREKVYFYDEDVVKILKRCCIKARISGKTQIDEASIRSITEQKSLIEKENMDMYKNGKILIKVDSPRVGSVNGLSVVGTNNISFGRPIRITCVCCKGEGEIIDVHKESKMSGKIHEKSVNILKAYINSLYDRYISMPVDFYISFEQVYGNLDGDSASVAEAISMLSALTLIPINQSIAVTGSINQFGEIQPVGGINEKIEGFFNLCKNVSSIDGKGVLIPESNVKDLVLCCEVEEAVKDGKFSIYTMKNMSDAVETLMGNTTWEEMLFSLNGEMKKFTIKKK